MSVVEEERGELGFIKILPIATFNLLLVVENDTTYINQFESDN
jgi:hypothetical protein